MALTHVLGSGANLTITKLEKYCTNMVTVHTGILPVASLPIDTMINITHFYMPALLK